YPLEILRCFLTVVPTAYKKKLLGSIESAAQAHTFASSCRFPLGRCREHYRLLCVCSTKFTTQVLLNIPDFLGKFSPGCQRGHFCESILVSIIFTFKT
uniref:Uncharacterized protein n=1 Tax=Aegilops tauschii subsp. strangulata TaxID=200361 RepID=A0A453DKM8_AEGTS